MTEHAFTPPPMNPDAAPFYEAAAQGRFLVPRCTACGKAHWYPRALCPFCFGPVAMEEGSGEGIIYSYSVMRRSKPAYAIAYVTLKEGPTMLTNLVDCDFDALRVGQAVRLVFKPSEGGPPVPCFTPA